MFEQLANDLPSSVDRNRKTERMNSHLDDKCEKIPNTIRALRLHCVDADHHSIQVDERTSRIADVDARICLNIFGAVLHDANLRAVPGDSRHDAACHGVR